MVVVAVLVVAFASVAAVPQLPNAKAGLRARALQASLSTGTR